MITHRRCPFINHVHYQRNYQILTMLIGKLVQCAKMRQESLSRFRALSCCKESVEIWRGVNSFANEHLSVSTPNQVKLFTADSSPRLFCYKQLYLTSSIVYGFVIIITKPIRQSEARNVVGNVQHLTCGRTEYSLV